MKKILVAYWSGTGNTEIMAKELAKGASEAGAELTVTPVSGVTVDMVKAADALALGCPAMGAEVLEENEVEPFISRLTQAELGGKPTGLFGSYDWGDGQWMRDWALRMKGLGAAVDGEGIIAHLSPDAESLQKCYDLGKRLAG
jgi:flavodoxin short chain